MHFVNIVKQSYTSYLACCTELQFTSLEAASQIVFTFLLYSVNDEN